MADYKALHVNAVLSNFLVRIATTGFVWNQMLPLVNVAKASDTIKVRDTTHLKAIDTKRKDKAESHGISTDYETDLSYNTEAYALHDDVSEKERKNADPPIKADLDVTENINSLVDIDIERRVATLLTDTSVMTNYDTLREGSTMWDAYDSADSNPREMFRTAKRSIYTKTFKRANVVLIPYEVGLVLADHPQVTELLKYTHPELVTSSGLPPQMWGLKVIEAEAGYDTASKGQTKSFSPIWGRNVIFAYVEARPTLKSITLGFSFNWMGKIARTWQEPRLGNNVTRIEVEQQGLAHKIISADCAYLVQSVIAA